MNDIRHNVETVRRRIEAACSRAGRDSSEVRLVAVTKTHPAETVLAGIEAGLTVFGENYVQEAQAKIEAVGRYVSWHFIGRLQTKKAKYVVGLFDLIHSVDSVKLAQELDKRAAQAGLRLPILIQVNLSGEATKGGVAEDECRRMVEDAMTLKNLDVKGLMTMPPFFDNPDEARPYFAALRRLRDRIGLPLAELSMGMSGDFEAAVEEGATLVRVGSAIFGARS